MMSRNIIEQVIKQSFFHIRSKLEIIVRVHLIPAFRRSNLKYVHYLSTNIRSTSMSITILSLNSIKLKETSTILTLSDGLLEPNEQKIFLTPYLSCRLYG